MARMELVVVIISCFGAMCALSGSLSLYFGPNTDFLCKDVGVWGRKNWSSDASGDLLGHHNDKTAVVATITPVEPKLIWKESVGRETSQADSVDPPRMQPTRVGDKAAGIDTVTEAQVELVTKSSSTKQGMVRPDDLTEWVLLGGDINWPFWVQSSSDVVSDRPTSSEPGKGLVALEQETTGSFVSEKNLNNKPTAETVAAEDEDYEYSYIETLRADPFEGREDSKPRDSTFEGTSATAPVTTTAATAMTTKMTSVSRKVARSTEGFTLKSAPTKPASIESVHPDPDVEAAKAFWRRLVRLPPPPKYPGRYRRGVMDSEAPSVAPVAMALGGLSQSRNISKANRTSSKPAPFVVLYHSEPQLAALLGLVLATLQVFLVLVSYICYLMAERSFRVYFVVLHTILIIATFFVVVHTRPMDCYIGHYFRSAHWLAFHCLLYVDLLVVILLCIVLLYTSYKK